VWDREAFAEALVAFLEAAALGVKVHPYPPELLNPPCLVIARVTAGSYSLNRFGVDTIELAIGIVHGLEAEWQAERLKNATRTAVMADHTIGGAVASCLVTGERNWRNYTGAGGIQLFTGELVLAVQT